MIVDMRYRNGNVWHMMYGIDSHCRYIARLSDIIAILRGSSTCKKYVADMWNCLSTVRIDVKLWLHGAIHEPCIIYA